MYIEGFSAVELPYEVCILEPGETGRPQNHSSLG